MDTQSSRGAFGRPLRYAAFSLVVMSLGWALAVGCGGGGGEGTTTGDQTSGTTPAPGASTDTAATAAFVPANEFKAKCAVCHGPEGMGDGPTAATLNPKPRNLHDTAYMNTRPDDSLFVVIKNGKGMMPAWGKAGMTDEHIRQMIEFIRQWSRT